MVENKHSINTILSFGAKSVNPKILEQLLTGRNKTADFLEKKVKTVVENGDNQFILVIGQRGMGKTHLLKVLHSRIWHYTEENKLTVAYFAEEEYGVANFFDFLLRILNSFIKWYEQDEITLRKKLEKLQETSSANQLNYLEKIIKEYVGNKPLLIITENFGDILDQMGQEEQGRLRAWLYENNNISIIASSQSVSDNFDREDRPFYGFFTPYYLKSLSFEESYSFLISLAEIEKNEKLIEHLKTKGKPQVRAIFDLVKGNHRLLVTFYHFLKTDMLAKVSEVFIKTINDLKPYYETYIRYLPAQQQKIIRYIALSRNPQLGVEISKNCFIEQKTLSKQLSELNKKRLVDIIPDPSDKRNKFYDISEPLLRISIEVGEHKEGITALFIDFLAFYYNIDDLVIRGSKFRKLFESCNEEDKRDIKYELDAIQKALLIKSDSIKKTISEILKLLEEDKFEKALEIYKTQISNSENDFNIIAGTFLYEIKKFEKAIEYFKKTENNLESTILKSFDSNYYNFYCSSLIQLYFDNDDENLLEKCVKISEIALIDNYEKVIYQYIVSRSILGLIYIDRKENNKAKELIADLTQINFEDISEKFLIILFEVISYLWEGKEKKFTYKFINHLQSISLNEKIIIYKNFSKKGYFNALFALSDILQRDIQKNNLNEIVTNWITNVLIYGKEIIISDLEFLETFINKNKKKIPELNIVYIYVNTYREVILNNKESALYELPKEQREFFEKNILNKKA